MGDPCCGGENWEVRQSRLLISAMLWGESLIPNSVLHMLWSRFVVVTNTKMMESRENVLMFLACQG